LAGVVALGEVPREQASRWPSFLEGRLNEVGLAFGFGHERFACGIVMPVVHCSDPRLTMNQRFLGSLEVSFFQAATIQIP
jgi:hypothetical protein